MGLDMYLFKEKINAKEKEFFKSNEGTARIVEVGLAIDNRFNARFREEIKVREFDELFEMNWRKANAIHAWFVEHVQFGVDDCSTWMVTEEQLQSLLYLCEESLKTKKPKLKTTSGFFFGSTDYNDWYWMNMEYTANGLRSLLSAPLDEDERYFYTSSW